MANRAIGAAQPAQHDHCHLQPCCWLACMLPAASTRFTLPYFRLYVIDLLPHVYRACAPNMPGGTPPDETVVAGDVAQLLVGLLLDRDPPPTHVAVVVDVPGQGTFRHALYPGFKHGRQAPKLVMDAVPRVLALVDALGWPVIAVPGVQADDVAASLALRANKDGLDAVIVSSHKVRSLTEAWGVLGCRATSSSSTSSQSRGWQLQRGAWRCACCYPLGASTAAALPCMHCCAGVQAVAAAGRVAAASPGRCVVH